MSELELMKTFDGVVIPIEIIDEKNIYFDISGIAKKYGKNITEWINSKRMNETLKLLEKSNSLYPLILRKDRSGTKIHRKLFVNFARFISPEFEIKADEIITEILLDGKHLCEKERSNYITTIKELKEKTYAKPRSGDYQVVDRIRQDYKIACSSEYLNALLVGQRFMEVEYHQVRKYISCSPDVKDGSTPTVFVKTLLDIVDDMDIPRGLGHEDINQRLF